MCAWLLQTDLTFIPASLPGQPSILISPPLLAQLMVDGTDCATGWKALSELQYQNLDYEAAHDTAVRGLRWLQARRERGHESLTNCALALRLVVAKSLRRLLRLDEAEVHFRALAGGCFLSGSRPVVKALVVVVGLGTPVLILISTFDRVFVSPHILHQYQN